MLTDPPQVMERACRELPRSYKLWKMVWNFLFLFILGAPHFHPMSHGCDSNAADHFSTLNSEQTTCEAATRLFTGPSTRKSTRSSSAP